MPETKEHTTTYDLFSDKDEALDHLEDASGAAYISPEQAIGILAPFVDAFGDNEGEATANLRQAVAQECILDHETLDITNCLPHEPILTVADTSAVLAEALGVGVGSSSAAGRGSSARQEHKGTVANIRGYYRDEAETEA